MDLQQSTRLELKIHKSRAYSGRIFLEKNARLGLKIFYILQFFSSEWINGFAAKYSVTVEDRQIKNVFWTYYFEKMPG